MKMRVMLAALAAALLMMAGTTGCSKGGKDKLVGTWKLDEAAVEKMMEDAEKSGDAKKGAGLGAAMIVAMGPTFEFAEDGSMSMTMKNPMKEDAEPKTEKGSYEVVKTEGDKLTLKTKLEDQQETITATFDGDDKLTLEKEGDEMPMVLERAS